MDIQTIRAFLHAHDPSTVWDVLAWLDKQNCSRPEDRADAYEYFRGALTADMRAAAIETIMAECWAETERITQTVESGTTSMGLYGAVEFRSWDGNHCRYWTSIRGPKGPRWPRSVNISDAHTLAALPIAIKRDLGDALAAEAKRRVGVRVPKNDENRRLGCDRRMTIASRINAWSMVACSNKNSGEEAQAAHADFQRWAADQYARLCVGFLLGPARMR